ncbi:heterogeneous nuclear ribonucleoprotein A1-like [Lineus longissimus]|uniref:heterogeneous nuclear ribonucleoprotein A1-like n=1 Tax=Lineus longissimus TaxID=88925 RepID=UPI002B4E2174
MDERPTVKESLRKIFVGGLNRKTDEASLSGYFSRFGEVVDCVVIRDKDDRSKGFGFVIFKDAESVDEVQKLENGHFIDSKEVETRRAVQRKGKQDKETIKVEANYPTKKIFLGGIKYDVEEKDLIDYFSRYAGVKSAEVIRDKEGNSRGFAYVVLDSQDAADKVCIEKDHVIKGRECEAKKSLSKNELLRHKDQDGTSRGGSGGGGSNYADNGNNQNQQGQGPGQNWNQGQGQNWNQGQVPSGPQGQGQGPPGGWNQGGPQGNWYGGPSGGPGNNWNQGQWGQGGPPVGNWNQNGPWNNWNQGPPGGGGGSWNQGPYNWSGGGSGNWQGGGPPQAAPDQGGGQVADANAAPPASQTDQKPAGNGPWNQQGGQWNQGSGGPGWQGQWGPGNWGPGNQQGNWGNGPWGGWNQGNWSGPPGGNWGPNGPPGNWNPQGGGPGGNNQWAGSSAPQVNSGQTQPNPSAAQGPGNWNQGQGSWTQGPGGNWNWNQGPGNRGGPNGTVPQAAPGAWNQGGTEQKPPEASYSQPPQQQNQAPKEGYGDQSSAGGPMRQKQQRTHRNSGPYSEYAQSGSN